MGVDPMIKFDILGEREKRSFLSVLDWQQNYKILKCGMHQKNATLNLFIDKSGSNVSINACCEEFFIKIVEQKKAHASDQKRFNLNSQVRCDCRNRPNVY
jgi:hypothetical protein